jgi:hypothetical protein
VQARLSCILVLVLDLEAVKRDRFYVRFLGSKLFFEDTPTPKIEDEDEDDLVAAPPRCERCRLDGPSVQPHRTVLVRAWHDWVRGALLISGARE